MKKYIKPSMEIVDLRVEDKLTAPTTFYRKGINVLSNSYTTTELTNKTAESSDMSF